ncbi:MHYT domain-containing protein [Andreprevotia chitinilytica]|uniref:MHYT domain-containing protein n=1 Tax=Andreprevotia chitinilytica TaxID=396808 RepID=UPI00068B953D|nr:MHYT domain-containing protein [Andreprevotia chitinilytica]
MHSSYDFLLVFVSYVVASLASYTALDLAGRITASEARRARDWLIGGSIAMGTGIWSMHFTGMMAFELPIAVTYNVAMTALSWVAAVAVSALALHFASQSTLGARSVTLGAVLMGIGICVMHYTGMAAMQVSPGINYDFTLVGASALIAVSASAVALIIAFKLREHDSGKLSKARFLAALVMGVAIAGMHYTGMAAANFDTNTICSVRSGLSGNWGGLPLAGITAVMLMGTLMLSRADAEARAREAAKLRAQAEAERLYRMTYEDLETGLPNRTMLRDLLNRLVTSEDATQRRFSVGVIDLHGVDELVKKLRVDTQAVVLTAVAKRIGGLLREGDTLVRWGHHSFAVLSYSHPSANDLISALQGVMRQPTVIDGRACQIGTDVGAAEYPADGLSPHSLMTRVRMLRTTHPETPPRSEPDTGGTFVMP